MWWCGMTTGKKDVHVFLPEEMDDEVEDQLEYGDSKSAWIREAIRQRLDSEREAIEQ